MGAERHSRSRETIGLGSASLTGPSATRSGIDLRFVRRTGGRGKLARALWVLLACLSLTGPARAESSGVAEYSLKAAFLFHFTKFVHWPEEVLQGEEIVLCVLGKDPFGSVLDKAVLGKTAQGRKIALRRLRHLPDVKGCHLLFLGHSERKRLPAATESLRSSHILIVSEAKRFGEPHGMVKLVVDRRKVRIEIDVSAARAAGLRISSSLLQLAVIREDGSAGSVGP